VEFIDHGNNGFLITPTDYDKMHVQEQDQYDLDMMYDILERQILPAYYDTPDTWKQIVQNGMRDVRFQFESNRMAKEYYELMYNPE
jgi:starch phosphorylase